MGQQLNKVDIARKPVIAAFDIIKTACFYIIKRLISH